MTHWCCVQARSFSRYYVKAKLLLPKNNIDWKSPIDNRELINKSECFPQAIIASIVMSFFSIPTFEFAFFCHSNGGSCWVKEQSRKQKKKRRQWNGFGISIEPIESRCTIISVEMWFSRELSDLYVLCLGNSYAKYFCQRTHDIRHKRKYSRTTTTLNEKKITMRCCVLLEGNWGLGVCSLSLSHQHF